MGDAQPSATNSAQCAYCGAEEPTTEDHVIPRCLFTKAPSAGYVKVPACSSCNEQKSAHDAFLRDYLTADLDSHDHPVAAELFKGKVQRAVSRNQSQLAKLVQSSKPKRVEVRTLAGIYLGDALQVPLPDGLVSSILFQMTRGLYFDARKKRLPEDIPFKVLRHRADTWVRLATGPFKEKASKTLDEVFDCAYMHATENPSVTWWIMRFYRRVAFTVETGDISSP